MGIWRDNETRGDLKKEKKILNREMYHHGHTYMEEDINLREIG